MPDTRLSRVPQMGFVGRWADQKALDDEQRVSRRHRDRQVGDADRSHGNSSIVWCQVVWHSPAPQTS